MLAGTSKRAKATDPVFGDFQTPVQLARDVWNTLPLDGVQAVIEPTVGKGAFLAAAPDAVRRVSWRCFDINPEHVRAAAALATRIGVLDLGIEVRDVFTLGGDHFDDLDRAGPILAVGNPPWVTSSGQAGSSLTNLPEKTNDGFGLRGLDALTGKANFDIAEAILLKLQQALAEFRDVRLAFLIKRSVALRLSRRLLGGAEKLSFSRIDAPRWFGASVDAGLFYAHVLRPAVSPVRHVEIADALGGPATQRAGLIDGELVDDLDSHAEVAGLESDSPVPWRQGIKHDLSRVLELRLAEDGSLTNGFDQVVDVEPDVLAPLYKGSDVANGRQPRRRFPLYQVDLSGPDPRLETKWPRLAAYLLEHRDAFEARRSRIYRDKHPYSLFGVGPYLLAPWKVAICGLYRTPRFSVLGPSDGRPAVVDDTCYLLPYADEGAARAVADHLNSAGPQQLIAAIADRHAKRPFTKAVLSRVAVSIVPTAERGEGQLGLLPDAA